MAMVPARAEVSNLEGGLPTEISDARVIDQGETELQIQSRWERHRDGSRQFFVEPQVQYGFAPYTHASMTLRGIWGSQDRQGSGDVRLEVAHQFLREARFVPALAVTLRVDVPTGHQSHGLDPSLRLAATKTLGQRADTHQIHANVLVTQNTAPLPEERRIIQGAIVAYSTLVAEKTVGIADVIRQHERLQGTVSTIAEVGLRRDFGNELVLSAGLAHGRGGPDTPRWRMTFGVEKGF